MRTKRPHSSKVRPVLRIRSIAFYAGMTACLISVPFLMVCKQVYITSASIRLERMNDSLSVLNREIAALRLKCERLSSKEQIEKIAQSMLHLEYPGADRIVIVKIPDDTNKNFTERQRDIVAFIKRSLLGERG